MYIKKAYSWILGNKLLVSAFCVVFIIIATLVASIYYYFNNDVLEVVVQNEDVVDTTNENDTTPTPSPTPENLPEGSPMCLGLNLYDDTKNYPDVIVTTKDNPASRNLESNLTVRLAASDSDDFPRSASICWTADKQNNDFYAKGAEILKCEVVCTSYDNNSNCDDKGIEGINYILRGHLTKTFGEFVDVLPTDEIKQAAKQNGLLFISRIEDDLNGIVCSSNPVNGGEIGTLYNNNMATVVARGCGKLANSDICNRRLIISTAEDVSPTPSPTPSSSPTPQPSVGITEITVDLDNDDIVGIEDFVLFVNYYEGGDCKIDFNNNTKCREIADFDIFVEQYQTAQSNEQ